VYCVRLHAYNRTHTNPRQLSKKLSGAEKAKTELQTQVNILQPECADLGKKLKASNQREIEMKEEIRRLLEEVHHHLPFLST